MADIIQIRRDTAANWTAANPILAQGEFGVETDTLKLKIGDGASPWTGLRYYHSGSPYEAGEGISINDFTINNTGIITIGTGGANGTIKANGQDIAVKGLGSAAFVDTTTLPNKDLSNLTSTGANIANWSSNVSNCIVEISQDIKLDLSSGTLKLKSGSKVYIPNGVGVFDTVTTTADITTTNAGSGSSDLFYFYSNGSFMARPIDACFSGASQPTVTTTTAEWYDTTNNVIKHTANTGSTWTTPGTSFPLCICSRSGGTITGIKQVFNGFGYIGSTIFALPGVKGLIPNGRKADGSLNNINFTLGSVKTATDSTSSNNVLLVNASTLSRVTASNYFYDEEKNIIINKFNNAQALSVLYGTNTTTYGKISNFATRTVFYATDYNDYIKTVDQVNINTTNIALKQDEATALNYDNISNCITEIPQDIKLELYNGTITLKSGSKLYIPNGAGVFDTVTLSSNKTFTASGSSTITVYIVYYPGDGSLKSFLPSNVESGASYSVNDGIWYDTTNNIIKRVNGGTVAYSGLSFPICVLQITNGTITSIDQVFNGIGYIGSTVFALPGVKALAPNGRNADGTLKSASIEISSVQTLTQSGTYNRHLFLTSSNALQATVNEFSYDADTNILKVLTSPITYCYCGEVWMTDGKIAYFKTNPVFHAVDYSEYAEADSQNVKLTGNQTIAGLKTFSGGSIFVGNTRYNSNSIELSPANTATNGGYIDFHYAGSSADYTSRIIEDASGQLKIIAPTGTALSTEPSESSDSGQLATTAFVNKIKNKNITNCILNVPQNINLTLSNGTLTLYAGSKITKQDGTTVTTTVNKTFTQTGSSTYTGLIFCAAANGEIQNVVSLDKISSGTTEPANPQSLDVFYNTTTNKIRLYNNGWIDWPVAFPLGWATVTNGVITSIKQIFNGFGFMGSTIYMLPGVTLVKPNGRNSDGTLKNIISTTTSVRTNSQVRPSTNGYLIYAAASQTIQKSAAKTNWYYDERRNLVSTMNGDTAWMIWGSFTTDANDKIISFEPKNAFRAVDYNDSEYIANCAMPSSRYVGLTLGASGSSYTAPADGYVSVVGSSSGSNSYVVIVSNGIYATGREPSTGFGVRAWLPVSKGNSFRVEYSQYTNGDFRFIFAQGSK